MKYIEADFIGRKLKWYCKTCESYHGVKCGTCEISDCLDLIDEAPTIVNLTVQLNNIAKPSEEVVVSKNATTTGGTEEFDALLNDVQGYQGSICCYCKNFNNNSCEHFGDLPTEDGIPLQCGKWKWRGVE